MDYGIVWMALAASGGGIASALLGWMESGENFLARKFGSSVLRAAGAGVLAAMTYPIVGEINWAVILGAALAGAGVDVVGKRLAGSIKK